MKELLKFQASWCAPCKALSETFKKVAVPYTFREIDIDEEPIVAAKFNIRSVPTIIIMEEGHEVRRKVGNMTLEQLKEFIE